MDLHILFGPTRAGKTKKAQELWNKYHYPMLSVDSRKVYKGLDIGTNKLQALKFIEQNPSVIYGGLDFVSPTQKISVYEYQQKVYSWIAENEAEILKRGGLILHGGTGLYLDAILKGLSLQAPQDDSFREYAEELDVEQLQAIVQKEFLEKFHQMNKSDRNNPRRLVRVIENARCEQSTQKAEPIIPNVIKEAKQIWYDLETDRDKLYSNISKRLERYLEEGWINEVEKLLQMYESQVPGLRIMGYKELVGFMQYYSDWKIHLENRTPEFEEVLEMIRKQHRNYAKRQITWGKKYRR